ncbi:penicillin acylase family protein [Gemmatimonas sp.]|jgi:penicillin amidase|uniref:penicillin acylase family protein n=1 Tax=Gemmatimonas sp. TaxID=1962908 RepID=UPI0037BFBBA1
MARSLSVTLLSLTLGLGATWIGTQGVGEVPPLGALLSPSSGLWSNAADDLPASATATIRYDARSVPHIFAKTDEDAARALGYVVARDRLFQLEVQSRAGEGTLTELVGDVALPADQQTRRLGMSRAAEKQFAALDTAGPLYRTLRAYAEGINAYRTSLSSAQLPMEYKLLQKTPREWLPLHSMNLLMRMGFTLAHAPIELDLLQARALVGDSAARAMWDASSPVQEPIQPAPRNAPRDALVPLPAPGTPSVEATRMLTAMGMGSGPLRWGSDSALSADDRYALQQERAFASNNWAVAPSRSASGLALLAGDPHLELTLPSIWYEVHMVSGTRDVGGVAIPGLPGIAIGYTRALAWSFTNTGGDVMDFWRETVDNAALPRTYELDGKQEPLEMRVEPYRNKDGRVIATDTVYYTHRGPMRKQGATWLSMRWTVLEAGTELLGFAAGVYATTAEGFLDSLAAHYKAPAQNMIVADTAGTIAIRSTGLHPIRANKGRGTDILDGRTRANDWQGFRTLSQYPQSVRPAQGFLASANQEPIDPQLDSLYLGTDAHYEIWRALQINRLLRADSSMTPDKMRRLHSDPGSVRAERLVPALVSAARARIAAGEGSPSLAAAEKILAAWDRRYTRDNTGARLFETSLARLSGLLWDELIPADSAAPQVRPSESRLLQLLPDSSNLWWDDRRTTNVREDRDRLIARALVAAYDTLVVDFGDPAVTPWTWGRVAPAHPRHLLRLDGFSAAPTPIDGGRGTLNPSVGSRLANFGASWRMVVELDKQPRIMAVYPGGQSGNPASPRYLDRLAMWGTGSLDSVRTPRTPADLAASDVRATLTLTR